MNYLYNQIISTSRRIKSVENGIHTTPLEFSAALSEHVGCRLYLKCEHLQRTGSFKLRGALAKITALNPTQAARGVIAASSGNHGMAVALAARQQAINATIYLPENTSPVKCRTITSLGATVIKQSGDCLVAEIEARRAAENSGQVFISPYNDIEVIAGQGTVAIELANQCPDLDAVFVAVGGGGLISGIGSYLKQYQPNTEIIGCWPAAAAAMFHSLRAGKVCAIDERETLSDATAGGLEDDAITLQLCQQVIDRKILVSEQEIASAMRLVAEHERWIIEGAAGVALAGALKMATKFRDKKIAVVLCGRNISLDKFVKVLVDNYIS